MNPDSHDLIQRHIAGTLTGNEATVLQTRLKADTDLRRLYLHYMNLDVALEAQAGSRDRVIDLLRAAPLTQNKPAGRWLSWRPLTAAAAGIVFGMFCTSVVFGYVMPRAVATASLLFALVDGSFEKQSGRLPSGLPTQFGVWSGDESEVVEKASMDAKDGKRALRFVRAEREPTLPNHGAVSCDVYQLVDLRSLKSDAALGDATLELSVQFLDGRELAGEPMKFICGVSVFAGSPEAILAEWPLTQKESLASGSGSLDSEGGSPRSWHLVTTKILLPPQADFAVVNLVVHKPKTPSGTEVLFGAQFADEVRLTLKTQPTLPVRIAQR